VKTPPKPPRPELLRRPTSRFGWLDDRLLHDRWLAALGAEGISVLVLLALAADARGASFFSRARMASALGLDVRAIDRGLQRLRDLELVAHRPWQPSGLDGVWQLLPVPRPDGAHRTAECLSVAQVLATLGFSKPDAPILPS